MGTEKVTCTAVPAFPPLATARLAGAVADLADRVADDDVRTQLHALSGIMANLDVDPRGAQDRQALADAVVSALEAGDEGRALDAARALARADRVGVRAIDWSGASGG